jgi:hypothetical protein
VRGEEEKGPGRRVAGPATGVGFAPGGSPHLLRWGLRAREPRRHRHLRLAVGRPRRPTGRCGLWRGLPGAGGHQQRGRVARPLACSPVPGGPELEGPVADLWGFAAGPQPADRPLGVSQGAPAAVPGRLPGAAGGDRLAGDLDTSRGEQGGRCPGEAGGAEVSRPTSLSWCRGGRKGGTVAPTTPGTRTLARGGAQAVGSSPARAGAVSQAYAPAHSPFCLSPTYPPLPLTGGAAVRTGRQSVHARGVFPGAGLLIVREQRC